MSDSVLEDLLLSWEDHQARDEPVSAEELCRDHPEHLPALRQAIARIAGLNQALALESSLSEERPHAVPSRSLEGRALTTETRYRVCDMLGRGGQGDVFRALDESLGREVALKRMRDSGGPDEPRVARFLREVACTGRLEHPGVVPVYGVGRDEEGAACYTMKLVRGETLDVAIGRLHREATSRPLAEAECAGSSLRSLLGRFVAVCNTVAYAHSEGIVHRDLKPANIMLGPFGETLVLDWGLAKGRDDPEGPSPGDGPLFDPPPDASPTLPGRAMGTPAFMSPEQAAGDWGAVGPASDVWALGATLSFLLTNQSPFRKLSAAAIMERARSGQYTPPRALRGDVPRPLDAICRKAMAPRPEDRYSNALDLATDIERWLADEPVSAYPDPWTARLGRWVRRHRTPVAAALVLLTTATISLGGLAVAVSREQGRTARALAEARDNFQLARDAVDEFGTKVGEERLLNEPGMEDLRRALLGSALDFHDRFVKRAEGDAELLADLGRAQLRIAAIRGQTESPASALEGLRQAIATLEQAAARRLGDATVRLDQAACLIELAGACQRARQFAEGADACAQALRLYEAVERAEPGLWAPQRGQARALHTLGTLQLAAGDRSAAETTLRQALTQEERLIARNTADTADRNALGLTLNNLAVLCRLAGRLDEADALYRRALAVKRRLVEASPRSADARSALAGTLINHAKVLEQRRAASDAIAAVTEALGIFEALVTDFPRSTEHRFNLGQAWLQRGLLLVRTGDARNAENAWRQAVATFRPVLATAPGVERYVDDAVNALSNLANLALDQDDPTSALGWADQAIALADQTELHALKAAALERLGRHAEALGAWRLAAHAKEAAPQMTARLGEVRARARLGQVTEARAALADLESSASVTANDWVELAAATILMIESIPRDERLRDPDDTRKQLLAECLHHLDKARAAGHFRGERGPSMLLVDPRFRTVRDQPEFRAFIDRVVND